MILRTDFLDDASHGSLFISVFISVCMVSECNPKRMLDDVLHHFPKNIVPFNHRFLEKKRENQNKYFLINNINNTLWKINEPYNRNRLRF